MRIRTLAVVGTLLLQSTFAAALTVSEGSVGDFGDSFASRTVLPAQADQIIGSVVLHFDQDPPSFDADWFAFTDLLPGSAFTLTVEKLMNLPISFTAFDDVGAIVVGPFGPAGEQGIVQPTVRTGIVPAAGELVIRVSPGDGFVGYLLELDAPRAVPEPATAALLGLGLAALAHLRRRDR